MKELKLNPIPDYGDHMTLDDFIDACQDGVFIDYDGCGNYATADQVTNILVHPSNITEGNIDRRWSHVVWYNK
jgi:hypothetical protein